MRSLFLLIGVIVISARVSAATFSYSDSTCISFTMTNGMIACVRGATPPVVPKPPQPVSNCAQIFAGQATANTNTVLGFSYTGLNQRMVVSRGQSRSIQLDTTGATAGRVGYFMTASDPIGAPVPMFMNVSTTQCDFSYANFDNNTGCASSGGTLRVDYSVGTTPVAGKCTLLPNTSYYINIRDEYIDTSTRSGNMRSRNSCPAAQTCGFVFQIQ